MDILKDQWSPALRIIKIYVSLMSLLSDPNPHEPLVPEIAATYIQNPGLYAGNARLYTEKYAGTLQNFPDLDVSPSVFARPGGSPETVDSGAPAK